MKLELNYLYVFLAESDIEKLVETVIKGKRRYALYC